MIVVMAGLPGTGKSTLARALADRLGGIVIGKDEVRAAAFGPAVDYSGEQDDLCMEFVYGAAKYVTDRAVIIDGRTYSKRRQVDQMVEALGTNVRVIECVCGEALARDRLEHSSGHPAKNRSYAMYCEVKAAAEPLEIPRLTVDTGRPDALARALKYLAG